MGLLNNKQIIVAAVLLCLIGAGCMKETDQTDLKNTTPNQNSTAEDIYPTKIVEVGTSASCSQAELRDDNNKKVSVPKEIEEVFECLPSGVVLSPNHKHLLYNYNFDLKLYNFENKKTVKLMSFYDTLEGLDCIWRDDSQTIACVAVNQEGYSGLTKIFILSIDDEGKLAQKKDFTQKPENAVNFTCGAGCYPGKFWFAGSNELKYEGHELIAEGQTFTIRY